MSEKPDITSSITIERPPEEVYHYFRNLRNLAACSDKIRGIDEPTPGQTVWSVLSPMGELKWRSRITEDLPGQKIAWQSEETQDIENHGFVEFRSAGESGTELVLSLWYKIAGGDVALWWAEINNSHPEQLIRETFQRMKSELEGKPKELVEEPAVATGRKTGDPESREPNAGIL